MPTSIQDYEQAAEKWRTAAARVKEAASATDLLRIPIPQRLALGMADLLVFPDQIMQVAAAREAAGWSSVWDASEEGQ